MTNFIDRIGDRIRILRGDLSQSQLAKISGVSQQTISGIEKGKNIPRLDIALAIAKALGISINELINEENHIKDEGNLYEINSEEVAKIKDPHIVQAIVLMEMIPEQKREYAVQVLEGILGIIQQKE